MKGKGKKIELVHPGKILLEDFLKPMNVSINKLSRDIMVPPNRISEIVNGKRAITADMALRLGKYFGISPEIWTGLQADYEIRLLKRTVWRTLEPRIHAMTA